MRLQKHVSRKIANKEYGKYVVVIPPEEIQALGWKEGDELKPLVKGKNLVLSPKGSHQ